MKILTIVPQYLPVLGGIEVFVDELSQSLRDRSVETIVITERGGRLPGYEVINGNEVYRLDFHGALHSPTRSLEVLERLVKIVEAVQPDLIHMQSALQPAAWYVDRLLKKRSCKIPFIVTQHGVLEPQDCLRLVLELLLKADVLTAVSYAVLDSSIRFSGRSARSIVIYNGVRGVIELGFDEPKAPLICVGRLEYEKGFDVAIQALAILRSDGLDVDMKIVGCGAEHQKLVELARSLGVDDQVIFEGSLDHSRTLKLIGQSSLILVPSRMREGFSLVTIEAALAAVPCVASRIGGLVETIQDGMTGILVEPSDHIGLASAVGNLLRDTARLKALGRNAQTRARELFDMNSCSAEYYKLYQDVLE